MQKEILGVGYTFCRMHPVAYSIKHDVLRYFSRCHIETIKLEKLKIPGNQQKGLAYDF